jgi:TonB family protein
MSIPTELWKKWEGRAIDGKFPLERWLGGSDHSAVFLTERSSGQAQKAAIKLIPAQGLGQEGLDQKNPNDPAQLSRWADAAKLSHPNLLRVFESGACQLDETPLLYVVEEYADENLAEILPLRALSADEASGMLQPAAEALAYLHQAGFVHGCIKPSNVMAVNDQLKISADGLCRTGERGDQRARSAYDAPEVAAAGLSTASDIWSLGATLVAVLTQKEPKLNDGVRGAVTVPETIPQPLRDIIQRCLQIDPQQRCTVSYILSRLQPQTQTVQAQPVPTRPIQAQPPETQAARAQALPSANAPKARPLQKRPKRWIIVPIAVAALFLIAWVGSRFMTHQPAIPAAEDRTAKAPAETPATQSPAPFSATGNSAQKSTQPGGTRGSVLQQVMPDVSPSALNTVNGRLKVSVQVSVDPSGSVSQAKLTSPGPSAYFANHALAAARRWKFTPPQVNGQAAASEWILHFQFRKKSVDVTSSQKSP